MEFDPKNAAHVSEFIDAYVKAAGENRQSEASGLRQVIIEVPGIHALPLLYDYLAKLSAEGDSGTIKVLKVVVEDIRKFPGYPQKAACEQMETALEQLREAVRKNDPELIGEAGNCVAFVASSFGSHGIALLKRELDFEASKAGSANPVLSEALQLALRHAKNAAKRKAEEEAKGRIETNIIHGLGQVASEQAKLRIAMQKLSGFNDSRIKVGSSIEFATRTMNATVNLKRGTSQIGGTARLLYLN
ncbi:MAG: hypothetical protein WC717_04675 [Candidatus Micrarchaeia archaeon]